MSKRTNTVLFVIIATVFNIFVTVACFVIFLVIFSKFLFPRMPESILPWMMPLLFVVSITASFLVYRLALKIFMKKVNLEEHFDPVFGKSRR